MAFTKQHYERVAAIAKNYHILSQATHGQQSDKAMLHVCFLDDLAEMFAEDNPRFDRERFLLACGGAKEDI